MTRHIARDISYAHSAETRSGRALIKLMENATGRIGLIRRAKGYDSEVGAGRDFWQVMVDRYRLSLDLISGGLDNIPAEGPVVVIANHPYGILDGLVLGHILSLARGDFRILAHEVFRKSEDLARVILPISFDDSRAGLALNLDTRRRALDCLLAGGAVGVFPGGTVSTAATPLSHPLDPGWRGFTARMIAKSGATVVPVYFDGHTSRMFQLASHLHYTLRMGLLIREFRARVGTPVRLAIGAPIPPGEIAARARDTRELMDFLRKSTYELSPKPLVHLGYGFEFEEKHDKLGKH